MPEKRLPPRPGDEQIDKPPPEVTVALMSPRPSIMYGDHWSQCIVDDRRPPIERRDDAHD